MPVCSIDVSASTLFDSGPIVHATRVLGGPLPWSSCTSSRGSGAAAVATTDNQQAQVNSWPAHGTMPDAAGWLPALVSLLPWGRTHRPRIVPVEQKPLLAVTLAV